MTVPVLATPRTKVVTHSHLFFCILGIFFLQITNIVIFVFYYVDNNQKTRKHTISGCEPCKHRPSLRGYKHHPEKEGKQGAISISVRYVMANYTFKCPCPPFSCSLWNDWKVSLISWACRNSPSCKFPGSCFFKLKGKLMSGRVIIFAVTHLVHNTIITLLMNNWSLLWYSHKYCHGRVLKLPCSGTKLQETPPHWQVMESLSYFYTWVSRLQYMSFVLFGLF